MKNSNDLQALKGGMVLYPIDYNINDANPDLSFCYGLNEYGKPVVFYIKPTEQAKQNARTSDNAQTVPDFAEFADTDRRAPKQCLASDNNGPKNPNGMLLMEQISLRNDTETPHLDKYPDTPVYEAKWASILREGDHMFQPPIGFGYMEIGLNPRVDGEVDALRLQYKDIEKQRVLKQISDVDAEEKKEHLYLQIMSKRQKWFTAVVLKHRQIKVIEHPSKESFANILIPFLQHYTDNGMYGGSLIRVRRGDVVDSTLSCYCNMGYDYQAKAVKPVTSVFEEWFKYHAGKILSAVKSEPSVVVEVIPTQRINFGKMSVEKYSRDIGNLGSKIMKTYIDRTAHANPEIDFFKDKVFLSSKIAVRLAKVKRGESKGGVLASTIHSFSSPLGNAFTINSNGEFSYKMDFFVPKATQAA